MPHLQARKRPCPTRRAGDVVTPEERARLLTTKGPAYLDAVDRREAALARKRERVQLSWESDAWRDDERRAKREFDL
jgi:hypothetical protein